MLPIIFLSVPVSSCWDDMTNCQATVHCSFKNESLEPAEDGMTVLPGEIYTSSWPLLTWGMISWEHNVVTTS